MRDFFDWLRTVDPQTRKKALLLMGLGGFLTLLSVMAIFTVLNARTTALSPQVQDAADSTTSDHEV